MYPNAFFSHNYISPSVDDLHRRVIHGCGWTVLFCIVNRRQQRRCMHRDALIALGSLISQRVCIYVRLQALPGFTKKKKMMSLSSVGIQFLFFFSPLRLYLTSRTRPWSIPLLRGCTRNDRLILARSIHQVRSTVSMSNIWLGWLSFDRPPE